MKNDNRDKHDICNYTLEELYENLIELDFQKYRAKQLFQWIYQKGILSFDEMTNISKSAREKLTDKYTLASMKIIKEQIAADGTRKYLFQLQDGETIESVLMVYPRDLGLSRMTVCVSTQVGCNIGCSFCATALGGLKRNLSTAEIIGQVLLIQKKLWQEAQENRVTNVVFMGMGEPFANYDNLIRAIKIFNSPEGLNISHRKMTVSTSGLVPQIRKLSREGIPVVLAISLHAADNKLRNKLVPINKKYPLEELLSVCKEYTEKTKRRVTYEYILIKEVNDRSEDAQKLVKLLKGLLANVNLIPYNSVDETGFEKSSNQRIKNFYNIVKSSGIETVIREEKGSDILAACGQLRRQEGNK